PCGHRRLGCGPARARRRRRPARRAGDRAPRPQTRRSTVSPALRWGGLSSRAPAPSTPREIDVSQNVYLALGLVETVLHDVADTHDATELAAIDHRDVANAQPRHLSHDVLHGVLGGAGRPALSHDVANLHVEARSSMLAEAVDDVTLRDQSFEVLPVGRDDQGADVRGA